MILISHRHDQYFVSLCGRKLWYWLFLLYERKEIDSYPESLEFIVNTCFIHLLYDWWHWVNTILLSVQQVLLNPITLTRTLYCMIIQNLSFLPALFLPASFVLASGFITDLLVIILPVLGLNSKDILHQPYLCNLIKCLQV